MKYRVIPVTPLAQNTTICWCDKTKSAILTDPGDEVDTIMAVINELDLNIERIMLTHGHFDHVGGAQKIAEKLNIPIHGPDIRDADLIRQLPEQCKMFSVPMLPAFEPDTWMKADDIMTFGEEQFEMRHCPGHTPGHLIFINRQANIAIVGDVIFHGAIGRSDFPGGNQDDLLNSIKHEILSLPDDLILISGHGQNTTVSIERNTNPYIRNL